MFLSRFNIFNYTPTGTIKFVTYTISFKELSPAVSIRKTLIETCLKKKLCFDSLTSFS